MINAQRMKEIYRLIDEYADSPEKVAPNEIYRALKDCTQHIDQVDNAVRVVIKNLDQEVLVYGRKVIDAYTSVDQ